MTQPAPDLGSPMKPASRHTCGVNRAIFSELDFTDTAAFEGKNQDRYATSRWAKGDAATARDLSGGWMDAGDTNKYTTFAQSAVLQLLDAYRLNPGVFSDNFGIPESGNGLPDVLDEVKWELEFLKRMQNATGTGGLFRAAWDPVLIAARGVPAAIDRAVNITANGRNETISSRANRGRREGARWACVLCRWLDWTGTSFTTKQYK